MPEPDGDAKNFFADVPPPSQGFFLKGSGSLDWGMSNRLARVFRPDTGRTVMLAIDHGYFQGPTTGLERVDLSILPLVPLADALMCTRGILRSTAPPDSRTPAGLPSQWWAEHSQRALRRADRRRHRRCGAIERRGACRPGFHRRGARDPVG